jgi:hypothetical protein
MREQEVNFSAGKFTRRGKAWSDRLVGARVQKERIECDCAGNLSHFTSP